MSIWGQSKTKEMILLLNRMEDLAFCFHFLNAVIPDETEDLQ